MQRKLFLLATVVLALILTGCGGGGGSDDGAADAGDPTIVSVSPLADSTGALLNSAITVEFSEAMNPDTITTSTFTLFSGATQITGTVSYSGVTAAFTPSENLSSNTSYTATISGTVTDEGNNDMGSPYSWSFTTMTPSVSFGTDVQPIFDSNCVSCHASSGVAFFLVLTSGSSYTNLVGVASTRTTGGGLLVDAGDSESSVLYQRISGTGLDPSEQTMPPDGGPLSASDQTTIKTWIDEGALSN
jgi:hypothetical protein